MNWDDLRIFLAVARHGLISRAAQELGTDATTVSRRIQRLERDVGQTLLERHRDGPRLTAVGRRFAERAGAMDSAFSGLRDEADTGTAPLRVSATEGFGTWFIAERLASFVATHPRLEVELVASSGFLSPSRRETDIAILLAKPRRGPLVTRKLAEYGLQLYGSRTSPATAIGSAADLRRHPLVGYIPDFLYAPELDYLDEIGTGLRASIRSSSINAQHRLIAAGCGVGVLPCFIGDADPALFPVLPRLKIRRTFWLSIHQDVRQRPQVRQFVDWLIQLTEQHRPLLLGAAS